MWGHLGLRTFETRNGVPGGEGEAADDDAAARAALSKAEANLPSKGAKGQSYAEWTAGQGEIAEATTELLRQLYQPMNVELRRHLLADGGPSCSGAADCDRFLWKATVT